MQNGRINDMRWVTQSDLRLANKNKIAGQTIGREKKSDP
jgi:hypothetical protein